MVVGWVCTTGMGLSEGSWKYAHQIHEIRDLVVALQVQLVHVPRSQNGFVDLLAKWGVEQRCIVKSNVNTM